MDQLALALRVVVSLAVVLGVMWALSRAVRGRAPVGSVGVDVVSRAQLGRHSSVVVLRVGDRGVLLGVTDQRISLLGDVELPAAVPAVERRTSVDLVEVGSPTLADVPPADALVTGVLAGSLLSVQTWRQAALALRERTVRT